MGISLLKREWACLCGVSLKSFTAFSSTDVMLATADMCVYLNLQGQLYLLLILELNVHVFTSFSRASLWKFLTVFPATFMGVIIYAPS